MTDKDIKQIVCGGHHTFILKKNGERKENYDSLSQPASANTGQGDLFAFGHNGFGQLGLGDYKDRNKPTLIMTNQEIHKIVCGGYNTFILKKNGELFAFGYNKFGQLGLGDNETRIKPILMMTDQEIRKIICGETHTFVLKNNGDLFAFGCNNQGQLGLGDNGYRD